MYCATNTPCGWWFIQLSNSPGGDDERGKRLYPFSSDHNSWGVSALHLSGHLTPDADHTEGRIHAIVTQGATDVVAVSHGGPQWHGGRWDDAKPICQREAEILPVVTRSFTGKAGEAPVSKTAIWDIVTAVTYPRWPFARPVGIHPRLSLCDDPCRRHCRVVCVWWLKSSESDGQSEFGCSADTGDICSGQLS